MQQALDGARENGNLSATTDLGACESASVAVVSVNLDLQTGELGPTVDLAACARRSVTSRPSCSPGADRGGDHGSAWHLLDRLLPEIETVLSKRGLRPAH